MKKVCITFIIFLLIFTTQVLAIEDYNILNKKREEASANCLAELLEKYKTDEVSEEERIIDYSWCGGGYDFSKEEGIFKSTSYFTVTPYLEENSVWKKDFRYMAFAEFSIVDGEYILEKVSLEPENYDKFLERFEEYKKNGYVNTETQAVQGDKNEELNSSNEIEKMSNTIFIISAIVLLIVIIGIIVKSIRKRK